MQLDVLVFGSVAVAAGADRVSVEVGHAPTVRDVLAGLHAQHPALRFALPPNSAARLAVNHIFAAEDRVIKPGPRAGGGDEVALITLVGGG